MTKTQNSRAEYFREYRKAHREKFAEYQRNYQQRQRAELLRLREQVKAQEGGQADE